METDATTTQIAKKANRNGSLYYLLTLSSNGSFRPFMWVYFTLLGITGTQIGWLSSLDPLLMLLAIPIATLADRKRWRVRLLQLSTIGLSICLFLLPLPTGIKGIAVLMVIKAIVSSPVMSFSNSLIARMAQRYKLNFGGMRLWGSLGFAASGLIFGAIWQQVGYKPMFIVAGALTIPLIIIAGKLEEGSSNLNQDRPPVSVLLRDQGLMLLIIASFLAGISNSLFMTFGGVYANYLGGGGFLIGVMTAVTGLAELPAMFYTDRVAERIGRPNTAILSYGLMALSFLGYVSITNPNYLLLYSIIKGLGYGLWFPVTVRILTERTPEEWSATAQSLLSVSMMGVAPLVAGPIGGLIYDAASPREVFWLGIVTLGMAALVLWWTTRKGNLD